MSMTHYENITKMCFLLNGRKQNEECYKHYDISYTPISIYVRNDKGDEWRVEFYFVDIVYTHLYVNFNGHTIALNGLVEGTKDGTIWCDRFEFNTKEDEKIAKKIFGENATPAGVITYTEQALKQVLREYKKQIEEALAGNFHYTFK